MVDKIWANSGDSHFLEPTQVLYDRLRDTLPADLVERLPRSEKTDTQETVYVDGEVIERKLPRPIAEGEHAGMRLQEVHDRPPGASNPRARLVDMDNEGVWGQVLFPSLGIWNNLIKHPELSQRIAQTTNDWAREDIEGVSPRFVCAAMLPLRAETTPSQRSGGRRRRASRRSSSRRRRRSASRSTTWITGSRCGRRSRSRA